MNHKYRGDYWRTFETSLLPSLKTVGRNTQGNARGRREVAQLYELVKRSAVESITKTLNRAGCSCFPRFCHSLDQIRPHF